MNHTERSPPVTVFSFSAVVFSRSGADFAHLHRTWTSRAESGSALRALLKTVENFPSMVISRGLRASRASCNAGLISEVAWLGGGDLRSTMYCDTECYEADS